MSQRLQRVRELLRRELGELLQKEFDFDGALVTVNAVDVTPDLRNAHVFISMMQAQGREDDIIRDLNQRHGYLQNRIAKRVVLKYTPQLHFRYDDSVKRGTDVVALIDGIDIPEELKPIGDDDVQL